MRRLSPRWVRGVGLWMLGAGPLAFFGPPGSTGVAPFGPGALAAQNSCDLADSRSWNFVARGTAAETHWFTRALFVCQDGSRIYSDSAIISPPQRLSQLFGNVRFTEEGRRLTADRANYRTDIDRLDAFGSVVLVDSAGGSRIEGENLVYLRGGDTRPESQLTVTGLPGQRSRAVILPRPSTRPDTLPADTLQADTLAADTLQTDTLPADTLGADTLQVDTLPIDTPQLDTLPADSLATAVGPSDAVPPDTTRTPYTVLADRIVLVGNESFRGEGDAEVERGALKAYGDNLVYDEATGELLLAGDARSVGAGYELSGQTITVLIPDDEVREVVARRQAALRTDDLDLTAPKIRIFVDQEALQRLVAAQLREEDGPAFAAGVTAQATTETTVPEAEGDPNRARAVGEDFSLVGDSVDVEMPGEVLERVHAFGRARAESYARDSLNTEGTPEVALHDWIEGDSLVATFAQRSALPDSAGGSEPETATARPGSDLILQRLVAVGAARSLYRMEPNDSTAVGPKRLAIHYVLGSEITIEMREGEIDQLAVSGETRGMHLEPRPAATRPDTLGLDTLVVDTLAVDALPADSLAVDGLTADTVGAGPAPADTVVIDTLAAVMDSVSVDTLGAESPLAFIPDPARRSDGGGGPPPQRKRPSTQPAHEAPPAWNEQ